MIRAPQFKAHPWHGISPGNDSPAQVNAFVEIVPTDTVKYEIDKESGYLRLDRPQRYSNLCPSLYGFIPRTLCGPAVAERCMQRTGLRRIVGDGDPLDICIITERPITHGDLLITAIPVGGFRMIDSRQADDKIIAVLKDDPAFGRTSTLSELPAALLERLRHYFLTYKLAPNARRSGQVAIPEIYQVNEAHRVITAASRDYRQKFS